MRSFSKTQVYPLARIVSGALVFLATYFSLCAGLAIDSTSPKARRLKGSPAQFGATYQDVEFHSADGTVLSGWFVPAKGASRGVIILCHGISSNRTAMLPPAGILFRHGYSTLLFDFRACGKSGGSRFTLGRREVEDLQAAIQYVETRSDTRALPLGTLGQSMGASVSLMGAARCPEVKAVVAESPFVDIDHAANNRFRIILGIAGPVVFAPTRWIGEQLIGCRGSDISVARVIGRISPRPILLIQDGDDRISPPEETQDLIAAAGQPKTLWFVPKGRHAEAVNAEPGEYSRRVLELFDRALRRRDVR